MKYYRRTATGEGPIESVGYGMFVCEEDRDQIRSYGEQEWEYDDTKDKKCIKIEGIQEAIRRQFLEDLDTKIIYSYLDPESYTGRCNADELQGIMEEFANTIADSYNPEDIIESADGFDNLDWTFWLWERVLEPEGITAIITDNGAVVFEEDIISAAPPYNNDDGVW